MRTVISYAPEETEALGAKLASTLPAGTVVALYGDLGMGKTAFVRGMAQVLAPTAQVSSPTFALVNEYGPRLVHFDMYRITGWDDLYGTGFFDYIESGAVTAVEWSENIEAALPDKTVRVRFAREGEQIRRITIEGEETL